MEGFYALLNIETKGNINKAENAFGRIASMAGRAFAAHENFAAEPVRDSYGKLVAVQVNLPPACTQNEHSNAVNAITNANGVAQVIPLPLLPVLTEVSLSGDFMWNGVLTKTFYGARWVDNSTNEDFFEIHTSDDGIVWLMDVTHYNRLYNNLTTKETTGVTWGSVYNTTFRLTVGGTKYFRIAAVQDLGNGIYVREYSLTKSCIIPTSGSAIPIPLP